MAFIVAPGGAAWDPRRQPFAPGSIGYHSGSPVRRDWTQLSSATTSDPWMSRARDVGLDNAISKTRAAAHLKPPVIQAPTPRATGLRASGGRLYKSLTTGASHAAGKEWLRDGFGVGKAGSYGAGKMGAAFRVGAIAFAGYTAYQGYKEGGIWGGAKALGRYGAENYLMGRAVHAVFGGMSGLAAAAAPAAIVGGALYGRAKAHTIGKERYRRHAKMEMGTPVVDQFGSVATMRQRSLQALNNSRLNGMTAMGNEATLMYRPYNR